MIDVLCVTTKLCAGGVQTFLINNVEPLLRYGIRLNFIVQDDAPQQFDEYVRNLGCKIYPVTPLSESKIKFIRDIRKILRFNPEIKIIHSHQNFANFYSLIAAGKLRVRISHSHSYYRPSSIFNQIIKNVFIKFLPWIATDYWACSELSAQWLYGANSKSERCKIIKNCIDTKRFIFDNEIRQKLRQDLNWENKEIWINIGTLGVAKNQLFLIELFNEFQKNHPSVRLLICGEGSLRGGIEEKINQYNLNDKVVLTGNINNPEDYLAAADMFIFPSVHEGFPLSCIEAQSMGIASVVSQAVPSQSIINPNFIICDTYSIKDWIKNIENVKKINFNRSEGAKNVKAAGYDINTEALRISNLYKDTLKR